jgi:hypothetical protein
MGETKNAWVICGSTLEKQRHRRDGRIKLKRTWWMQDVARMPTGLDSIRIGVVPGYANRSAESSGFYCKTCFRHLTRIPLAKDLGAMKQTTPARLWTPFEKQVSWALLEKPPVAQPLKKFPTFYGTQRFITVSTRASHWSLFWARSIQSIPPHP